jgi:glutamate-ammonia-ligase adenylyltransferase
VAQVPARRVQAAYPRPADAAAAARFVADFTARLGGHAATAPRALLDCLGGNSPYLSELALREPETLLAILATGPDAVCDQALGQLAGIKPELDRGKLAASLRHAKRAVALAAAVADIGGQWALTQVTGALTDLADSALRAASAHLLLAAHARGDIRLPYPAAPERGSGFVVLAMGKLGARELNFSSDVDLILLYDPAAHQEPAQEAGHVFARMARDLTTLMEARDAGGYVFRVDLRLRPDPGSTPPCIALPAALAYYESLGQTWERAVLIKARPVAGDLALGRRFLAEVRPFIWRRHLDFAAMADIHAMKRRMDAHKGTRLGSGEGAARLLGHDLKLGEGGIREIEFCAHTLQLVWGGREPELRVPATLPALHAQAARSHLPETDVAALADAYNFLRRAEHRLQMVADRQTHALPSTPDGLARFATFLGYDRETAFAAAALHHLRAVHGIFAGLFASLPASPDAAPAPAPLPAAGEAAAVLTPFAAGWMDGRPRALRTERSRVLMRDLLPALDAAIARQPDAQAAAVRLDEFIHRLPAGVQVFSMLQHNPALLERLADVLGAAPSLADHLASFPAALEGLAAPQPVESRPVAILDALLRDARGLDDALAIASRMVRAEDFAIAAAELFGWITVDAAARARTAMADAVMVALLRLAMRAHRERYGTIPGSGMAVVALGKAGSGEMMAGSDLDLMLIYDHPPDAVASGGASASQYFARAAHAFIAALTVQTRHGPLYAVDMRLRPSGKSGPVAVSLPAFERYYRESAWTWERLALTRARVVAGPPALRRRVASALRAAIQGTDPARVRPDTAAMRARLLRDMPAKNAWDIKLRAGGLMEVDFIAQALQLLHAGTPRVLHPATSAALAALQRTGALPAADARLLIRADRQWRGVQSLLRITLGRSVPAAPPPHIVEKMVRVLDIAPDDSALPAALDRLAAQVRAAFVRHIGEV